MRTSNSYGKLTIPLDYATLPTFRTSLNPAIVMLTRLSKVLGLKGNYLALCRKIGTVPIPISVPIFGEISTIAEILNIHDNFATGELRDPHIEDVLRNTANPVVVDCGINIGVTVRWWLHLNPSCKVFGIDMMQEAHDFTRQRLAGNAGAYTGIAAALSSVEGEKVTIHFSDPLEGTNSIGAQQGATSRTLVTACMDSLLAPHKLTHVEVLKMDIEGYGAKAFAGASKTLAITRNVVLEFHSEEELGESAEILVKAGFRLRRFRNRSVWFTRAAPHPS